MLSPTLTLQSRTAPLCVVVADDVVEIQSLVRQWLSEVGCSVLCASNGAEVTQLLRAGRCDLIITDIIMPEGDGLEVIAEVRRVQPGAKILAISGGGSHLQATDCLQFAKALGAHAVLLKPFNREQLLSAISQVVREDGASADQDGGGSVVGA